MMKFNLKQLFLFVGFASIILTVSVAAQSKQLKLVFAENGKSFEVKNLKVDIVSTRTHEVLQSLTISKEGVEIPPDLAALGDFDVHISFDQFSLILGDLNWEYFDNQWKIDVNNVSAKKTISKKPNSASCKELLRIFRVDFHPSNGEGFWWLIPDCSQKKSKPV